ncbi:hypothetical protein [uncultured Bacteroides sp.]|uniref:hypothetical protein n=1 Tax=uncultured Bacteroides sp. TaxID=162156 RepID=UPI002AAB652B|nr:hypothetical protein [uncultured Bacteroides sp.]
MERIANFEERLSSKLSRNFVDAIVVSVQNSPEDFGQLYSLIKSEEIKISWRAAWACEKLSESNPEWLISKYEEITQLTFSTKHSGTKRLFLSILHNLPVPSEFPVELYNFCLEKMLSPDEAIAIQALSVKLAYKIALKEPELLSEIRLYLENAETEYFSTGVKNCIQNVLKKINSFQR